MAIKKENWICNCWLIRPSEMVKCDVCKKVHFSTRSAPDISGQRFGMLVAEIPDEENKARWLFKCDCGKYKVIHKARVTGKEQVWNCGCRK